MNSYKNLLVENHDGILVVTINRPHALNALNDEVFKDLIQLFVVDIEIKTLKGVIITGAGDKAFVAGADIKEFLALDNASAQSLSQRGHDIFHAIERLPIPVIAAVNGYALGGGCELAMACHLRVAGANAKFGQPEVNLGILPGYGGTQRLPRLIGRGKALELLMTADMIGAEEAVKLGLANVQVEAGLEVDEAKRIIAKISKKAPLAISEVIGAVNDYYDQTKDGFLSEAEAFGRLAETEDFKEGAAAFVEKRKAEFKRK